MRVLDVKIINKATIKAIFSIEFEGSPSCPPHIVKDFKLMNTNGNDWIALPSKEGGEKEGKKVFYPTFMLQKDHQEKFKTACIELLKPFLAAPAEEPSRFW